MTRLGALVLALLPWASAAVSLPPTSPYGSGQSRATCQAPKNSTQPLTGCAAGTILVGPTGQFQTVQSAILALPNNTAAYTILIQPGNYTEQVNITRPGPVTLLGTTSHPNNASLNLVNIVWANATGTATTGTYDNLYTSTLTIAPTLNSSATGSGTDGNPVPPDTPFGNTDFRAYNVDFTNDYAPYSAGPALAISVSYANAGFYYSGLYSYQDTVYVGKIGSAYFYDSVVAGQTDFMYGFGTLWVQSCDIRLRSCGGGITAWKGTNTTFVNAYGVYIHDSNVRAANDSLDIVGQCALGRPWNGQMRSVFSDNYLDDSILPAGFVNWEDRDDFNTTMAEYRDYGPGFNLTARLAGNITMEWDYAQFEPYSSPELVFQFRNGSFGNTAWIDTAPEAV